MNQSLIDSTIRNQVYLERLKAEQVGRFTKFLRQIDKDLRERLTREDLTAYSRTRFERLLGSVNKNLSEVFKRFQDSLENDLVEIAEYESEFESKALVNAIDQDGFESVIPSPTQVKSAIFAQPLSVRGADGGKLLQPFIADWSQKDRARVIGVIRQGFFEGQTNFQIIQNLRGTKARNYQDGVLGVVGRNAEAIVRTSVQHVASVARFETWEQNKSVVKGYEWVSTLDSKTTQICAGLDGQKFKLGNGPKPPAHIRCRSTTVATLDAKYDYLDEGATRSSRGPDGKSVATADEDYFEWLKKQPAEFQDDALGPIKGKLFRDGGLSPERFRQLQLNKKFQPLTLDEMRRKEPNAFKKAFGSATKTPKKLDKPAPKEVKAGAEYENTLTGQWHTQAFKGSRKAVTDVAKKIQNLDVVNEGGGAWARQDKVINMSSLKLTERKAQNTWRHEFGHIVDYRRGGSRWGYASSREEYVQVMKSDAENLKAVHGVGKRKKVIEQVRKNKLDSKNRIESTLAFDANPRLSPAERVEFNKVLAKEADLDYDKLTNMLVQTTGDADFQSIGGAYRLANIIEAVRLGDAQTFMDFASFRHLGDPVIYRKTLLLDGWLNSFSDLVGAATRNRVLGFQNGYPGHSNGYYAQAPLFGPTETFANLTATYGHENKYVWEIVKRFTPNLANIYLEIWNES